MSEVSNYLVLNENNEVVNIIVYDGVAEYNPGEGLSIEEQPKDGGQNYIPVEIGATKNEDGTFTNPEPILPTE
jgi:hypothetical protein